MTAKDFSFTDPVFVFITVLYVLVHLMTNAPLTRLMQQYMTGEEYRIVFPPGTQELFWLIVGIWFAYAFLLKQNNWFVQHSSVRAYLQVADIYFKTHTIYQTIVEPALLGKGDKFVLNLYEK